MTVKPIHQHYVAPREKAQTQPIHAHNGKVVGRLNGDTLTKTVHSSRHLLRKPPAWALDVASLEQARALGAQRVALYDADTGARYVASLDLFDRYAFELNRGYGQQKALPLAWWTKRGVGEPEQGALWWTANMDAANLAHGSRQPFEDDDYVFTCRAGMAEFALVYAQSGWPVFPCKPGGKTPLTTHGVKDATTDEQTIRQWWKRWRWANIGIDCGGAGLVVVDIDVKNGAKGLDAWAVLRTELGIDDHTPSVCTPSKGLHLYYAANGHAVRNSAGKLGQGIDIRAVGGYVVAPPSRTPQGEYFWEMELGPANCPILPLPEALADLLAEPASSAGGSVRQSPEPGAYIAEGSRNDTLARMAGSMRRKGFDVPAIEAALLETNIARCVPPLPETEVKQVAASIGRYEAADDATSEAESEDEHLTDLGNARRLVALHGQNLLYCSALGGWLVWDGRRWALDETGQVVRYAKETVESIYDEAMLEREEAARGALMKHAIASESAARIRAMVELAQTEPGISVTPGVFDADPWLLNVANGTLDLRTGQLREHERSDMLTKLSPVEYAPNAVDETLERYLATVTEGDEDFAAYLQRAAGYSLTGQTSEECFFLVLGPAATGKTTLVEALLAMMGDYGIKSSFSAFLATRNVGGPTPEIVRLRGARLVAAVEAPKGGRLNEVAIKELTGGDTVTARNLYSAPFSFKPRFKLWLAANDCPRMTDTDTGLWRRLQRLPFEHELPESKRDPQVKQRLCNEALPALLAWAVRGCLAWQQDGLRPASVVRAKTAELRADFDPLAEFLKECCVFAPTAHTPALELRQAYESWAASMGARPISNRDWSQRLKARGCESIRTRRGGSQTTVWQGVGLLSETTSAYAEPSKERASVALGTAAAVQHVQNKRQVAQTGAGASMTRSFSASASSPAHGAHGVRLTDSEQYYLALAETAKEEDLLRGLKLD